MSHMDFLPVLQRQSTVFYCNKLICTHLNWNNIVFINFTKTYNKIIYISNIFCNGQFSVKRTVLVKTGINSTTVPRPWFFSKRLWYIITCLKRPQGYWITKRRCIRYTYIQWNWLKKFGLFSPLENFSRELNRIHDILTLYYKRNIAVNTVFIIAVIYKVK